MRFTSDQMREANAVRGVLERLPAEGTESPHRFTVTFPASFWSSGLQGGNRAGDARRSHGARGSGRPYRGARTATG